MASFYELTEDQIDILREGLIVYAARLIRKGKLTEEKTEEINATRKVLDRE